MYEGAARRAVVIFRIAGGKVAEAWEVYDEAGMWRRLGVSPLPE
jgi:hypothetical protein